MSSKMCVGLLAVSGVVLVSLCGAPHASAEGAWSATGSLHTLRSDPAVVRLQDGRVLAAGGWDSSQGVVGSAEIYDPATGAWTLTGSMHVPRSGAAVALLQDGRVLVAGGRGGLGGVSPLSSAELFDPASGQWQLIQSMADTRGEPSVVSLQDGRVLVTGGADDGYPEPDLRSDDTDMVADERAWATAPL
jgi:large repetitive protein